MPSLDRFASHWTAVSRGLRSSRALLATAIFTMTVAIGLNVAMFGLVDRALLSPARQVADPASLFAVGFVREGNDGRPLRMTTTSYPACERLRDDVPAIRAAAAWQAGPTSVVVSGAQVGAVTHLVSGGGSPSAASSCRCQRSCRGGSAEQRTAC